MKYLLDELSILELDLYNSIPKDLFFDVLANELEANGVFQKY